MKRRVLIIPAAGLGTRLHSPLPKLLVPVGGIAMIDRLQQLYADRISRTIIVTNPAARPLVEAHVGQRDRCRRRGPGEADRHAGRDHDRCRGRRSGQCGQRVDHLVRSGRRPSEDGGAPGAAR